MKETTVKEFSNADKHWESELIRRALAGNQQAFTELVSQHQKGVFKLAYGFFQDRDDAMEIVQETFIRVYQKLESFDGTSGKTSFKNWVFRIANNLCVDYYRKFKKKKADDKELYQYDTERNTESANPADDLDKRQFQQSLKMQVQKLSKRQKTIFMLRHYNGMKHQEISGILKISVSSVKSQYCRAVKFLEKQLLRLPNGGTPAREVYDA